MHPSQMALEDDLAGIPENRFIDVTEPGGGRGTLLRLAPHASPAPIPPRVAGIALVTLTGVPPAPPKCSHCEECCWCAFAIFPAFVSRPRTFISLTTSIALLKRPFPRVAAFLSLIGLVGIPIPKLLYVSPLVWSRWAGPAPPAPKADSLPCSGVIHLCLDFPSFTRIAAAYWKMPERSTLLILVLLFSMPFPRCWLNGVPPTSFASPRHTLGEKTFVSGSARPAVWCSA